MKLIETIFIIMAVAILLVGGIAAVQQQSNLGDAAINESSANYDEYVELKNNTAFTFTVLGYSPYLLMIVALAAMGGMAMGAFAIIRKL